MENTTEFVNHYKTLEIDDFSAFSEVKIAFRSLAKKYHPDVNNSPIAEEIFKHINEAYSTLSTSDSKAKFDEKLREYYRQKEQEVVEFAQKVAKNNVNSSIIEKIRATEGLISTIQNTIEKNNQHLYKASGDLKEAKKQSFGWLFKTLVFTLPFVIPLPILDHFVKIEVGVGDYAVAPLGSVLLIISMIATMIYISQKGVLRFSWLDFVRATLHRINPLVYLWLLVLPIAQDSKLFLLGIFILWSSIAYAVRDLYLQWFSVQQDQLTSEYEQMNASYTRQLNNLYVDLVALQALVRN